LPLSRYLPPLRTPAVFRSFRRKGPNTLVHVELRPCRGPQFAGSSKCGRQELQACAAWWRKTGPMTVISVENLSKSYLVGHQAQRERYTALRDVIGREARNFVRKAADLVRGRQIVQGDEVEEFWALKDVSFTVRQGEVLGIIGRNGAGKSTLLKILSRITEPTAGRVRIKGRVASLLEVGTGFHPELTGRENIYLNGAILGMTQREIRAKFDEIVAFADVERFLDTPMKRFSSGMYMRLAFAVAAHLEPEILVIDEVLAVGDASFQKKCLGKMSVIAGEGRTVLFVSHNMAAISALCQKGIYLQKGYLIGTGPIHGILATYSRDGAVSGSFERKLQHTADATLVAASVTCEYGGSVRQLRLHVELTFFARQRMETSVDFRLKDSVGLPVAFGSLGALQPADMVHLQKGINTFTVIIPADILASGTYTLSIDLTNPQLAYYDRVDECLSFDIEPINTADSMRALQQSWGYGSVLLKPRLLEATIDQPSIVTLAASHG